MSAVGQTPWTCAQLDTLRAEWADGTSAAEIGRLLGRSKNAVVGKAHRLGLPGRPSPIIRQEGQQKALEADENEKATAGPKICQTAFSGPEIASARHVREPTRAARACEWINGQRGAYTKCGAPISRGSYCVDHAAVCYVGQKENNDES